jgi:hypothetical protein
LRFARVSGPVLHFYCTCRDYVGRTLYITEISLGLMSFCIRDIDENNLILDLKWCLPGTLYLVGIDRIFFISTFIRSPLEERCRPRDSRGPLLDQCSSRKQ